MNYAVEIERRAFYNIAIKAIHTFYKNQNCIGRIYIPP